MSQHATTASRAGVTIAALNDLIEGHAHADVAEKLGVSIADIGSFIAGATSLHMANRLGVGTIAAANALALALGPKGAAGVVIGLLIGT